MTRLAEIAVKSGAVALLPSEKPVARRFPCPRCGVDIGRNLWACEVCAGADRQAARETILSTARDSVPAFFRPIRFGTPAFAKLVHASPAAIAAARAALSDGTAVVTLRGDPSKGKTTLACAMLAEVVDAGADLACHPTALERARYARFVDAVQLSLSRQEHRLGGGAPDEVLRAKNASVLVLDEFGKDDRRTVDVAKIIHDRHAAGDLTIVTTWMDQAAVAAAYDGGVARRLFEKAVVIRLGAT